MALVLGWKKWEVIFVGSVKLQLVRVLGIDSYLIKVGPGETKPVWVSKWAWTDIAPGIKVRSPEMGRPSIVFDEAGEALPPIPLGAFHEVKIQISAPGINVSRNSPKLFEQGDAKWS